MKVTYKQAGIGIEVTHQCSKCGVVYAKYVLHQGERMDINWSETAPMFCSCGEPLLEEVTTIVPRIVEMVNE